MIKLCEDWSRSARISYLIGALDFNPNGTRVYLNKPFIVLIVVNRCESLYRVIAADTRL